MKNIDKKIVGWEVLDNSEEKNDAQTNQTNPKKLGSRPFCLDAKVFRLSSPHYTKSIYVTFSLHEGKVFEVFISTIDSDLTLWLNALARSWSAIFRLGIDFQFLIDDLKKFTDPRGGYWKEGKFYGSYVAHIGWLLEGLLGEKKTEGNENPVEAAEIESPKKPGLQCPVCSSWSLIMLDGCLTCTDCDYSKCG